MPNKPSKSSLQKRVLHKREKCVVERVKSASGIIQFGHLSSPLLHIEFTRSNLPLHCVVTVNPACLALESHPGCVELLALH